MMRIMEPDIPRPLMRLIIPGPIIPRIKPRPIIPPCPIPPPCSVCRGVAGDWAYAPVEVHSTIKAMDVAMVPTRLSR
jgi:hypothetical protein